MKRLIKTRFLWNHAVGVYTYDQTSEQLLIYNIYIHIHTKYEYIKYQSSVQYKS